VTKPADDFRFFRAHPEEAPQPRPAHDPIRVSAVICAYNEERNLPGLLTALRTAQGPSFVLDEILVIASGCTDGTVEILESVRAVEPRLRVIVQPRRDGKASALNVGLAGARGSVVVVENADTIPTPQTIEELVRPFRDPAVRLVTSRPVPVNGTGSPAEKWGRLIWRFHDTISRVQPKAGEAFAIRRGSVTVPEDIEDDDTFVQAYCGRDGRRSVYARNAIVYNRVPRTLGELASQRFRINRQIVRLYRGQRITTATWNPPHVLLAMRSFLRESPTALPNLFVLMSFEIALRFAAIVASFVAPSSLRKWVPIPSTKPAIPIPAEESGAGTFSIPSNRFSR
jgi:glycosyltransferase involved in cell wall biosynthesis